MLYIGKVEHKCAMDSAPAEMANDLKIEAILLVRLGAAANLTSTFVVKKQQIHHECRIIRQAVGLTTWVLLKVVIAVKCRFPSPLQMRNYTRALH